jgi:hypothetical protein
MLDERQMLDEMRGIAPVQTGRIIKNWVNPYSKKCGCTETLFRMVRANYNAIKGGRSDEKYLELVEGIKAEFPDTPDEPRKDEIPQESPFTRKVRKTGVPVDYIKSGDKLLTLADLKPHPEVTGYDECITDLPNYINNLEVYMPDIGLSVVGSIGTGKTTVVAIVAVSLIENDYDVLWLSAPDLAGKLKHFHDPEVRKVFDSTLLKIDNLIIDDLGSEFRSEFTISEFERIICWRHDHRKATSVTSNLTFADLEKIYGKRVVDRFKRNKTYTFVGQSFRG